MFVNGPPEHATYVEPGQCTTGDGWPAFDVVIAVLEAARTGYAVTRTDADYKGSTLSRPSDIGIGAALTALAAISAGVGFSRVSDCNEAINDSNGNGRARPAFRRRVAAPPSYAPPAAPPPSAAEPSVQDQTPPAPAPRPAPGAAPAQQADPE